MDSNLSTMPSEALQATRSEVRGPLRAGVGGTSQVGPPPDSRAATQAQQRPGAQLQGAVTHHCASASAALRGVTRVPGTGRLCLALPLAAGRATGGRSGACRPSAAHPMSSSRPATPPNGWPLMLLARRGSTAVPRWQRTASGSRSQRQWRATEREGQAYRVRRRACRPPHGCVRAPTHVWPYTLLGPRRRRAASRRRRSWHRVGGPSSMERAARACGVQPARTATPCVSVHRRP